ncbi:phasin family protein [Allorhizobium undicola]|uniref:phasin family protein n=1 Tax=Allorhizobium undicola TaxID=78527 RepID=UPI0004838B27|nr:phasin family protein [Allorhizobium undicola]
MFNFEEANKKGKEAVDSMVKNYSEVAKGWQAIAAEASEYSKKSFQDLASHVESLTGVRSVEAAMELQLSFAKSSYESMVAEATKIGEMYADLAKTAYRPFEAQMAKSPVASAAL